MHRLIVVKTLIISVLFLSYQERKSVTNNKCTNIDVIVHKIPTPIDSCKIIGVKLEFGLGWREKDSIKVNLNNDVLYHGNSVKKESIGLVGKELFIDFFKSYRDTIYINFLKDNTCFKIPFEKNFKYITVSLWKDKINLIYSNDRNRKSY